ncbi:autophagy-related protein 13-domain-containing protein [Neohortaea acidophila]|uniref:Autophagy-related protein 13 n=1 Tax=Neohortaea acidophila TaxID=245834 RepID=A0A6A6Q1H9_9PEZI|nr:autophagy-related protein 13-domain-containing protein [Neohortaea acidophila]KAF2485533.1 autophagy-related protein 13-domain-containing protein [Neohortaea acidophila]
MHQLPRPSPRSATPASNPTTNPERTNNSRDRPMPRSRSSVDLASYTERAGAAEASTAAGREGTHDSGQDRELTKLNQIIQHFHTKAALLICSSRANLPRSQNQHGDIRQNRWFNVVVDETDVLLDHLQEWRRHDLFEDRPRPLVIEMFLDTAHLTSNQVLVIKDDAGRRHNVANALSPSTSGAQPSRSGARQCEVVLERWTLELGDANRHTPAELDEKLPNVYKKGVVLFRSLYTFLRIVPAFKLYRKLLRQTGSHQALKLKFRIKKGRGSAQGELDSLLTPLCPHEKNARDIVEHYAFQPLVTPAGPLHCSVHYRKNCVFGIADAEALISDQFHGLDERMPAPPVGRSLPGEPVERPRGPYSSTAAPTSAIARERARAALSGTYGSLGTFHSSERRGSPLSTLRQRTLEAEEEDMGRSEQGRTGESVPHRKSVDYIANPPFKAGSLTSSPRPSPSPSSSVGRNEGSLGRLGHVIQTSASKRTSLNALPQQQLRTPSLASEVAVGSPASYSPKPAPARYSSSFANRPRRFTSQSGKTAESNASSGRGSSDSKEKSEHLHDPNQDISRSAKTDDDDIASFISDLERSKDIKFHTPPSSRDNVVNLAKYSNMRDPSTQLAEEMSSSSLIQTSSTPPSRRLSNVPGLSISSSPSRALTHAPHVRSRLSVAEPPLASSAASASGEGSSSPGIREVEEEDDEEPFIFPHHQDDNLD